MIRVSDDKCWQGGTVLHAGGNYNQNQNYGLFYLNGNNSASNSNGNIGSRIRENDAGSSPNAGISCGTDVAHLSVKICRIRDGLVLSSERRKGH